MIFHNINQNSEEWDLLRAPRITSSSLGKVMANYGKPFGAPAVKYARNIALSKITGKPISAKYSNAHMSRGHEDEPLAIAEYENLTFCNVLNGGFFECGDIGCSPDGLVSSDGLIEIKSAMPDIHLARIESQSFDSAYKWQLIGNLKFTGREWIDFISYCGDFPEHRRIYVFRCYKNMFDQEFKMIDSRINEFKQLISSKKQEILNGNYFIDNNATQKAA